MFVPSTNLIVLICFVSRFLLDLLIGFPYPQRAPIASHVEVFSSRHVYLLKRCSFFIWIYRFSRVLVVMLVSFV